MVISPNFGPALTSKLHWRVLVLDEGHKAKNSETQIAAALRKVVANSQHTVLLTGTPLQNNLRELWALLSLLHPDVFTSASPFEDAFRIGGRTHAVDAAALGRAHHCLAPFCLRRTKAEVEVALPPKVCMEVVPTKNS
jgi:SWI/SNF-related matrix-associated actin-dependent regulator of chromatin subfamily A member 5